MIHVKDLPIQQAVTEVIRDIQSVRIAKGVSKYRLAKLTGLHASTIGLIERGERNPSLFVLLKITEALEVSLGSILGEHESCAREEVHAKVDSRAPVVVVECRDRFPISIPSV